MRFSVQLLNPSGVLMGVEGKNEITREEVEEIASLFLEAKASSKILQKNHEKFIN